MPTLPRNDGRDPEETHFERVSRAIEQNRLTDIRKMQAEALAFFSWKTGAEREPFAQLQFGKKGASKLEPGQMFTYVYDAKHAATLPYWDRQPLIIFLGVQDSGNLLGLNLHYLPPFVRSRILGKLIAVVGAKKLRHDTRLKLTYSMVKSIASFKPLAFCVKSYIPSRVGKITRIQPEEWHFAVLLPSEAFLKKSKSYVWRQSGSANNGDGLRR